MRYYSRRKSKPAGVYSAVIAAVIAAAAGIFSISACNTESIKYKTVFYFVYCYEADVAVAASSLSQTVNGYGGAGYILQYDGKYYVTAACYYRETDALSVCESLNRRGLSCGVLSAERDKYALTTSTAKNNSEKYKGNINTLYGISSILYDCANRLDSGTYSSDKARGVIKDINDSLGTLYSENPSNCFTAYIAKLSALCEDCIYGGYIYAKDVRYIQLAIADSLLSVTLA